MHEPPLFYALILFVSAILGGGIFLISKKQTSNNIKLLLAFSAAYLLALTLLHLLPDLVASGIPHPGWYVIGGFILQLILDYFSHGIEHGHAHAHGHDNDKSFLFSIMIALWIHAFIEGMPFGGILDPDMHLHLHAHDHGNNVYMDIHDHRNSLLIGISIHKVTESLVFMALLMNIGITKKFSYIWMVVFAMVAPLGAFTQFFLGESGLADLSTLTPKVTGVLIGILLHVSTVILFESEEGHKFNRKKFVSIILGIAAAALVS